MNPLVALSSTIFRTGTSGIISIFTMTSRAKFFLPTVGGCLVVQGLTSHSTHFRSFRRWGQQEEARACRWTATTARNLSLPQPEDAGHNYWRQFLCRSAHPATRDVQHTNTLRPASVALSWTEHCGSAACLPRDHRRLSHVRRQCMAWFYQGVRMPVYRLSDGPRLTPCILLAGCTDVQWPVQQCGRWAIQQGSSLVEPRTACSAATVIRRITTIQPPTMSTLIAASWAYDSVVWL